MGLSDPLTLCGDSHPDSSCADGSWADVNDASRFGLSRARRDACGVRRIESDDEPSTWAILPRRGRPFPGR